VRSVKALPGTVVHLKQVDPRSVESRARAGRDLFIINQGAMHRALSTLPDPARPKLLEFSKRVRDCNQVVREFGKMHEVFKKMQETGLLSCLGQ